MSSNGLRSHPPQSVHGSRTITGFVRHCIIRPKIASRKRCMAIVGASLDASKMQALLRLKEKDSAHPLFVDPLAEALSEGYPRSPDPSEREVAQAAITTRYIDEQLLLHALKDPNPFDKKEYNQVVLVGDGFDTRPFRLPWPTGTILYLVATAESHELAEAILNGRSEAKVPQGCLLRRVDANFKSLSNWSESLERAGFRGDRLSVWGLQGLADQHLSLEMWSMIFQQVDFAASFESVVLGELPEITDAQGRNLLAENGFLGFPMDIGSEDLSFGKWKADWGGSGAADLLEGAGERKVRRLFLATHQRPSLEQLGIYQDYRKEFEAVDEDGVDNIM